MNSNSQNPRVGKAFQATVKRAAEAYLSCSFEDECPVLIGNPPPPHKFDVVSSDGSVIIECKCYTWTEGGNVPSAKLATLDEAVLYMRSVTYKARKIIAIKKAYNHNNSITLAEYFCDKKGHLLDDIEVWEVDDNEKIKILRGDDL